MKATSRPFIATLLTLAASASLAWWLRAEDTLPKAQPIARYDTMTERSPFTAPTAATPAPTPAPVVSGPQWWDQMVVTSLMDRNGVYYAALWDHASNRHYMLEINKADPDSQLMMSSVHWDDRVDQTTVTVSRGTDTAPPLKFDASATAATQTTTSVVNPYLPNPVKMQPPFTPPPRGAPINPSSLPPGFTGTPPPPPPGAPSVVRRNVPISSNPSSNGSRAPQVGSGPPRRIIVPNNSDSND